MNTITFIVSGGDAKHLYGETERGIDVRFAISAVAAVSGLVLLGLAFYGQPALYLHQARQQWTSLTGGSVSDQPLELDRDDPAAERIAQLQQQVTALKKELAAEPAPLATTPLATTPPATTEPPKPAAPAEPPKPVPAPVQPLREASRSEPRPAAPPTDAVLSPVAPVERPEPSATQPAAPEFGAPKTEPRISESPKLDAAMLDPAKTDAPKPAPAATDAPRLGPVVGEPPKAEAARVEPPKVETPKATPRSSEPPRTETASLEASRTDSAKAEPAREAARRPEPSRTESARADAARPDVRRADPVTADPRPEVAKAEALRSGPPKPEAPGPTDAARAEASKPAPQKLAVVKPAPAPPPSAQPLPPRQETEDAQSVLARLRQLGPTPPRQSPPPPPSTRPAQIASPLLQRLAAARAALADGRIEDARRLLQETQLQLVFRPIDASGEDSPRAGRSAANVAHSLEALSANNIPLSRRFIERAADDLSERGGNATFQEPDLRATGYAPAYPPH